MFIFAHQISHVSTSYLLSDRTKFPSFLRTVPSDVFQSQGLAQLVLHFGWTWVGLVAEDNDYGFHGIRILQQNILKFGICVEFIVYIQNSRPDYNIPHIIETVKKSTAKVVVVYSIDAGLLILFDELIKQNVTGKTWVASEAWSTSLNLLNVRYWKILLGTVGFAFHSDYSEGFRKFVDEIMLFKGSVDPWDNTFLEDNVGCAFKEFQNFSFQGELPTKACALEDRVENFRVGLSIVTEPRSMYSMYCAVKVIAQALHDLSTCKKGNGPFINRSCSELWNFRPWQVRLKLHL